jgi:hypothetical protein
MARQGSSPGCFEGPQASQEIHDQHGRQKKEQKPVEQLRQQKEDGMTLCIAIQPQHTQHATGEDEFSHAHYLSFVLLDLPVLKLWQAKQQNHQAVDKIRAQQKGPTVNTGPEQKSCSGD